MKWSLEKLQSYQKEPLEAQAQLDLKSDLTTRYPEEILDATPFDVNVSAIADRGDVIIDADVAGTVTVPSSRSLTPFKLPLQFHFTEVYVNTKAAFERYDNDVVVIKVDDDGVVDFDKAVADNVIVQIPMQLLSPAEQVGATMPAGDDWEVISEADYQHQHEESKQVDPRLASLKQFYTDDDDKA
ncbi:YceD family protein [Fructilactobacillus hinvesii]|uniref:YceD family protein n=1 Tax=Fructilactobacillus hinvesii TaxID=2940300 RepID=A0ABY5BTF7_9LACO|nr:YceD family protein [Fructilactobacillus hinvesii]USS87586.1 YceD family protein [Fructilactobacillus hinvesii]